MDTRQDYDESTSSEVAPSVIVVGQNEETPGQHLGEEPDTQDDNSHDEADLDDEMDVDDEGSEYMGDTLDGLSDGESNYQPREDSKEHQPNGESEGEDNTSDDEMTVDDEVDENSEDMLDHLFDGLSDDEHSEATSQQGQQPAASEDPATQESAEPEMQGCEFCGELRPIMAFQPLPCGDEYCNLCIIKAVELSLSSTLHFPAKCCQKEIPPEDIEGHVNRQCLKFIPPNNTSDDGEPCYGDEAECPACNDITCTMCKNKAHTGDCERQNEWEQSLDLAESEGWKRCSRCGHLIERAHGCHLMGMSRNQLTNLLNLLTYTSKLVPAAICSATAAVKDLRRAIANRISILPFNNSSLTPRRSVLQRPLMLIVLGSHIYCETTTGRVWRDPVTVVREYTPILSSVQPALFVPAMAAETALLRR
ncbi:e3 ubiquitin ligase ARI10 [Fusarium globosum]|uniref:E3 ubiquitin ligase ARI10 n=1 Tax=Fusarium globosum TaxID=78864 RepID=A0A8H6DMF9_9HYPO|nr:e3 ubiquitin ligase ARI10 [Fusarium globosum]